MPAASGIWISHRAQAGERDEPNVHQASRASELTDE